MKTEGMAELRSVQTDEVRGILNDVRDTLAPDKHAILVQLLESYVQLTMALSEKTASLARIRRLFGLVTTERLAPPGGTTPESGQDSAAARTEEPESAQHEQCEKDQAEPKPEDGPAASSGEPPRGKRKNHGRRPASQYDAKNTHLEHPTLKPGNRCPDCGRGNLYRFRTSAPTIKLIGQPPITAESFTSETLRCATCGTCFSPELPEEAKGPKNSRSAIVILASMHYALGMPMERLEQWQAAIGVPLPVSIQWGMLDEAAQGLFPVFEALKEEAAKAGLLHLDDTPTRILELMGKRREAAIQSGVIKDPGRTGIYTTGVLGLGGKAPPVALFFSGPNHAGENLEQLLAVRPPGLDKPVVMSDGLNRNVPSSVMDRVIHANCLSHGRRGVFDQLGSFPEESRYVLEQLAKVFITDAKARNDGLSPHERLRLHQRRSGPVLGRLRKWIRIRLERRRTIEPNSELGRALNYILRHWQKLTLFLRRPDVPLTNNICERLIKTAIRYRKNSLFYKTCHGARVGDCFMSIIQTARLNNVDPMRYLDAVLGHPADVAAEPERWLPWNYTAALQEAGATDATDPREVGSAA